jgi:2-phosphosulfolactate phosphatase
MLAALANGAVAVIPVAQITEALAIRRQRPEVMLAGERNGVRILAPQSGGVDFDFGNSPREFIPAKVAGRTIVTTTTNGTRALRACAGAREILVGAFLNLQALANHLRQSQPRQMLIICSGTFEQAAYEDVLAAGALAEMLVADSPALKICDAVLIAQRIYQAHAHDLPAALRLARNGQRLLSRPELRDDVPFCAQRDTLALIAALFPDGAVRKVTGAGPY